MQPTGLERRVQPNGAPRTSNDERPSTGVILVRHSTQWALLSEQRVNLPSVGQGAAEWLFNLGAQYEVTDQFAVFGSAGRTLRASSRVDARRLMFLVGVEITYGSDHGAPGR